MNGLDKDTSFTQQRRFSSISTFSTDSEDASVLKIITLGNVGVGKSTLLASYVRGTCQLDLSNQNLVRDKIVERDGSLLQLGLWDTAGRLLLKQHLLNLTPFLCNTQ